MGGGRNGRGTPGAATGDTGPRSPSWSTSPSSATRSTLSYVYAPGDAGVSWTTKARGAVRDIRGEYLLNESGEDRTEVTYRLAVDLGVLVPGFVGTRDRSA